MTVAARVPARSRAALAGTLLAAAIAFCILVALGVWQIERRAWKHSLIAQVDARIHAAPVAAPGPGAWPAIGTADAYRRVTVEGVFEGGRDTLVQAVTALGPGWWVLTPMHSDGGFTVLVNRGYVPSRAFRQAPGRARLTGLLRLSEPKGGFLRRNNPTADHWYSRDVAAIAVARRIGPIAPYFIDADAMPGLDGTPVGGLTVVTFPDNHLQYALTWFALAALLAGGMIHVVRVERRLRRP